MMPSNLLRSVVSQCSYGGRFMWCRRNFSSSLKSNESKRAGKKRFTLVGRVISVGVGFGLGTLISGDEVSELEEKRQKYVRKWYGESAEIVDLREKMWSTTWFVRKS